MTSRSDSLRPRRWRLQPWRRRLWRARHALHQRVGGLVVRPHPRPVFILGHQKSGTTAVAALLAHLTATPVTLDLRGLLEPVQHRLHTGALDFDTFVRRNRLDFSRPFIKEPSLTFLYPHLRRCFPEARYVFVVRDPRDTLRSILDRLGLDGRQEALSPGAFDALPVDWQRIVDGRWMGLPGDTYVDQLAGRWRTAAEVALAACAEDAAVLVRYEDFVADKEDVLRHLAGRLGLAARAEVGHLLDRPFQPAGRRGLPWAEVFSAASLRRITTICGPQMDALGYPRREVPHG